MSRRLLLPLLCAAVGCDSGIVFPAQVQPAARYADLVPLRAAHLVGPEESPWSDYAPTDGDGTTGTRASPALYAALQRLRGLGIRQVVIEAAYAWTTDPAAQRTTILSAPTGMAGDKFGTCQAGDMGLSPYRPPVSWSQAELSPALPPTAISSTGMGGAPYSRVLTGPFMAPRRPAVLQVGLSPDQETAEITVAGTDDKAQDAIETLRHAANDNGRRTGKILFASISRVTFTSQETGATQLGVSYAYAAATADRAEAALRRVLQAAADVKLTTILYLRNRAVPASPRECAACAGDGDCTDTGQLGRCAGATAMAAGICRIEPAPVLYLDPSSDPKPDFATVFAGYRAHLERMTAIAVEKGVSLLVIGGGAPYLTGGGQSPLADGRLPRSVRPVLSGQWEGLLDAAVAVRGVAQRPLFGYAAQDFFPRETERDEQPPPEWASIGFWGYPRLDVVGVDLFLPGRGTVLDNLDTTDLGVADMVRYGQTHGLASDGLYGNLGDLEEFAGQAGLSVRDRPVLLFGDGAPAVRFGAALSQRLPLGAREPIDFKEQAQLIEAHLLLVGEAVQRGAIGGVALGPFAAQVGASGPSYGGMGRIEALRSVGYARSDYLGLFDTPTEGVVRKYYCPIGRSCP